MIVFEFALFVEEGIGRTVLIIGVTPKKCLIWLELWSDESDESNESNDCNNNLLLLPFSNCIIIVTWIFILFLIKSVGIINENLLIFDCCEYGIIFEFNYQCFSIIID